MEGQDVFGPLQVAQRLTGSEQDGHLWQGPVPVPVWEPKPLPGHVSTLLSTPR